LETFFYMEEKRAHRPLSFRAEKCFRVIGAERGVADADVAGAS
jgi:hypothetical protein